MFWRKRKMLVGATRTGRSVAHNSIPNLPDDQSKWDAYFQAQRDSHDRMRVERLLKDQREWPDSPWPDATYEDRKLMLDAQQSIDERYAERHPQKTYAKLALLRKAAEMGGLPLAEVLPYIETFHDIPLAATFIRDRIPLEYAIALQDTHE